MPLLKNINIHADTINKLVLLEHHVYLMYNKDKSAHRLVTQRAAAEGVSVCVQRKW